MARNNLFFIVLTTFIGIPLSSFCQSTAKYGASVEERMKEKTIRGAQLGHLICRNELGIWVLCSGSEFEQIKGFATSVPYVTANKVTEPGVNKTEFVGFASISAGEIRAGNYLCPCEQNPGMVKKCDKTDFPYAKAMEGASANGNRIKVKVLGYRR